MAIAKFGNDPEDDKPIKQPKKSYLYDGPPKSNKPKPDIKDPDTWETYVVHQDRIRERAANQSAHESKMSWPPYNVNEVQDDDSEFNNFIKEKKIKMEEFLSKVSKKLVIGVFAGLLFMIVTCGSCFSVSAGNVGVTFNMLSGSTKAYSQGTYLKLPFVVSVVHFDVKTLRNDIKADSASKDLQKVRVHVVINYHLDYTKVNDLYVRVGKDYVSKIIVPAVNESVKASTAQFPVEEIIVKREDVKNMIEEALKTRLAVYNIILESVNLVDISFDEEFSKVVEEKQIEEQKIKTAEYKKKQAEQEKLTTILEAEGEARKQELLRASISKDTIMMKWIDKWDGKLPTYMMGDKTMMMVPNKTE